MILSKGDLVVLKDGRIGEVRYVGRVKGKKGSQVGISLNSGDGDVCCCCFFFFFFLFPISRRFWWRPFEKFKIFHLKIFGDEIGLHFFFFFFFGWFEEICEKFFVIEKLFLWLFEKLKNICFVVPECVIFTDCIFDSFCCMFHFETCFVVFKDKFHSWDTQNNTTSLTSNMNFWGKAGEKKV